MKRQPKQVLSIRVDSLSLAMIRRFAEITGQTDSEFMRSLFPPGAWSKVAVIESDRADATNLLLGPILALASDALRDRMTSHAERPMDPRQLAGLTPDGIAALYVQFNEAIGGNNPRFELVKTDGSWAVVDHDEVVGLADMIAGLRSDHAPTRIGSGMALARSIGAGLRIAGEHEEDVENLLSPQISEILGRAMAGETAAVDELEAMLNTRPSQAPRDKKVAGKSKEHAE